MDNLLPSGIDEVVIEFKTNKKDLENKSNAYIFIMLEVNDKYYHYNSQELNDKLNLRNMVSESIITDNNDAVINFICTTHEIEADDLDLVVGKCNYDDNCNQVQIKKDIKNIVDAYKKLTTMYNNNSENETNLYQQFVDCYEASSNGLTQFCLLYPKTINQNNSINIDELQNYFNSLVSEFVNPQNYTLNLEINSAILSDINNMQTIKPLRTVSHASILIDPNNVLHYKNDAVIVSINGQSLHHLYEEYGNNLLEANLRFYIRSPKIDNAITGTIKSNPEEFWYLNNGLTIICNNFKVSKEKVELFGFSIVNGGQTTYLIRRMDAELEKDLFIVCKIIKMTNHSTNENEFISKIAQASNRQKPIRDQDLIANRPEQVEFAKLCENYGLIYEIRRGMPKAKEPWQRANVSTTGKLFLASILQVPADSRANSKTLFNDAKYDFLFPNNHKKLTDHACIASQLAKIDYCYHEYILKDINKQRRWPVEAKYAKNAKTVVIAFVTLISRIANHTFELSELEEILNSLDLYKSASANSYISNNCTDLFPDSINFQQIYNQTNITDIDDLQDKITPIFDYVVVNGYKTFAKAKAAKQDLTETNYLKSNVGYYQFLDSIISHLGKDIPELFNQLK